MVNVLIKLLVWFIGTNTFKLLLKDGLEYIVSKTKNTIDDKIADAIIESVIKSKGNRYKDVLIADVKKVIKSSEKNNKAKQNDK